MLMKLRATKAIYDIVVAAVNVRVQSNIQRDDSLQMLLDANEDHRMIVGVCFLSMFPARVLSAALFSFSSSWVFSSRVPGPQGPSVGIFTLPCRRVILMSTEKHRG